MLKRLLYFVVSLISTCHSSLLTLNDAFEYNFTDKELHFIIIGLLGMAMVFVIHPIFKYLARHHHEIVITWVYVFTVIIVLTFAIEIGQGITHTGAMEFADIMFGVVGFLVMFLIYAVIRGIVLWIVGLFKKPKEDKRPRVYPRR